jgi:hypothetical protein
MKKTLLVLMITLGFYILGCGQSPFTQGNLVIYRVGDEVSTLANTGNPVFLDEYSPTGTLVQSVSLPTTVNGSNYQLVASGTASSEGFLTLSVDEQYLLLTGYGANIPYASSLSATTATTVPRVVGVVNYSSNINTSTALTDFSSGNNPRAGCSTNGTDLWVCGGAGGARYTTISSTTSTQLSTTPTNLRGLNIFDNQLYTTSGSGSIRLATVGTGLPTTSGQTITNLPGFPTTGSPYGFFFADLSPSVTGLDVVYVADDGGNLQKYSLVGGSWVANGSISVASIRGLAGSVSGTTVTLYGTTSTTSLPYTSTFISLVDATGYNVTISGTVSTLVTFSSSTKVFRGIAFAPYAETIIAPTIQASNITFDNILQTQMDVAWTNGNGAKRVVKINTVNSFTAPANGTDPTANPVYGGSGQQVVYNGSDNTIPTVSGLTTGTTYWFKVFEYNGSGTGTLYCTATGTNNPKSQATASAPVPPIIIEPTFTDVTATSAILGGNITATGGAPVTQRGTVWSITSPVTINDNKLAEGGTGTGVFSHLRTSMPPNTTIYFAAYATNSAGTSLTDESSFTTFLGEPTNHALNFTATAISYSTITVTWLDNDGAQPATGFLVLANTTGTFTDPVDGVPVTYDPVLSDGSAAVTVLHGVQTFSFYSLTGSTPYYFTIYPYTNSDVNIDYKVTPPAPAVNITTPAYVPPLAAWTFDETLPNPNTPTSVVANIGFQAGTATLYADGTNGSSLWDQATELDAFNGTLINDPREGGAAIAGKSYCPLGGTGNSSNLKSMVIRFSMEDYENPVLSFATRGTSTGFDSHQWAWSTNNVTYTNFGDNTVNTTSTFLVRTLDMSAIDELDQAIDVYLRITFDGASSASGNNRLDNIVIYASELSGQPFSLNLKVFLEGAYNTTTNLMSTNLSTASLLPLGQPFNPPLPYYGNNTPKWLYNGTQTVTSFPAGTVDYILIELRDAANAAAATSATRIAQVPAFVKSDGSIVNLSGTLPSFTNTINNSLFIVIWSRNHVGIMNAIGITPVGTVVYDFSTSSGQVNGGALGYKLLETGVWGMASGDINADGAVNPADKSPSGWKVDAGKRGYLGADLNMNGQVNNPDKNGFWVPNNGNKTTQVPN